MKFQKPIDNFNWEKSVTQLFGVNRDLYSTNFNIPGHNGIDLRGDSEKLGYGTLIKAAHDYDACTLETDFPAKSKGNGIRLFKHLSPSEYFSINGKQCVTIETIYWHLSDFEVKMPSSGKAGDIIGKMGNTGQVFPKPSNSCPNCPYFGTHLHFSWRAYSKNGLIDNEFSGYRDPVPYMYEDYDKLPVSFSRDLYIGRTGDDVSWLQTILKIEGFGHDYEPTGYFGSKTLRDVIKLQTKHGIKPAFGYVGPVTRSLLDKLY